jgi:hypothetical protein
LTLKVSWERQDRARIAAHVYAQRLRVEKPNAEVLRASTFQ